MFGLGTCQALVLHPVLAVACVETTVGKPDWPAPIGHHFSSSSRIPPHHPAFSLIIPHFSSSSYTSPYHVFLPPVTQILILLFAFMSNSTKSSAWLITELERELKTFDDNAYPLPTYQRAKFKAHEQLLREDASTLATKPSQYRSRRLRFRALLEDIFLGLGPAVFVLCTISTTPTNLTAVERQGLIPELRKWWEKISHPRGLATVAAKLCGDYAIRSLIGGSAINGMQFTLLTPIQGG